MKKLLLAVIVIATALSAATKPAAKKPKPKATVEQRVTIPTDAVETEPYTYRYTDAKGKKWIYKKTPFGVVRYEDQPVSAEQERTAQAEKARMIDSTTVVEDGDYVRFERPWPFGKTSWRRKKTELNEIETAVWNREVAKRASRETATKE